MSDAKKQLTVAKLIEELNQCPPDAPVYIDGCLPFGEATKVIYDLIGRHVWLMAPRNRGSK